MKNKKSACHVEPNCVRIQIPKFSFLSDDFARLGICAFALHSFALVAPVALYKKSNGKENVILKSDGSNLLFRKELCALFKRDLIRFIFVLFTMLFPFLCQKKQKSESLVTALVKDDIRSRRSFKKSEKSDPLI